jgi:Protein of unknown function (DUF4058)
MPVHDWSNIKAGIFHDFHHAWIEEIKRALNGGVLPADYYALAEQRAGDFGPDVLTLQVDDPRGREAAGESPSGNGSILLAPPKKPQTAESDMAFYRRKQDRVSIRHVSDDGVVAIVEVVSPGNKSGRKALQEFVDKAGQLLQSRIHLLVLDVLPRGPRDPNGIHGAIWEDFTGDEYCAPGDKPLTVAAYESAVGVRCFVEHVAVGDVLPDMPLFLKFNGQVPAPLERTYSAAFQALPRRWQRVLEK